MPKRRSGFHVTGCRHFARPPGPELTTDQPKVGLCRDGLLSELAAGRLLPHS